MSKIGLKKALKGLNNEELIELICDIYDARKEAKEYLEFWISPNPESAFEKAKEEIYKKFFYSSGKSKGLPAATELKKIIKDFSTISFDSEQISELMLYLCQTQAAWLSSRTSNYMASARQFEKNVANTRAYIENAGLEERFRQVIERYEGLAKDFIENPPEHRYRRGRRRWW